MLTTDTCAALLGEHPHTSDVTLQEGKPAVRARLDHVLSRDGNGLPLDVLPHAEGQQLHLMVGGFGRFVRTLEFLRLLAAINDSFRAGKVSIDDDGDILYWQHRFCAESGEGHEDPDAGVFDRMIEAAHHEAHVVSRQLLMARLHEAGVPTAMREELLARADEDIKRAEGAAQ